MKKEEQNELVTINPTTGKVLKKYATMTREEAMDAVEKCHKAFSEWRMVSTKERAKIITSVGKELKKHSDELTELMANEMGKLLKQGKQEVELCAGICDWTAQNGPECLKEEERELSGGGKGLIAYEPIGVIYGIQPWNFPVYQVIRYSIANLMAGNGVLLKHAENVTGSALMLQKIYEKAGVPKHLFTVLKITHKQSDAIINHKLVRGVTLTGSPDAGREIAKKAGAALKKTVLELGSNDAYIVLKDADLDLAVKMCVRGRIYNNGETCVAAKRFIVEAKIYNEFRDAFVAQMKNLKTGDPMAKDTKIGPMAREDLREKLHKQVEKSVKKGARILCGGEMPQGKGYFYPATVLENVKPGQPAYDDELFGPVASLIKAENEAEAMRIANDSVYGLGGGIFSKNEKRAMELAQKHFDTGMVFVNGFGLAQPNMPFGGVKESGYGREHGGFGMKEFVNVKAIMRLTN